MPLTEDMKNIADIDIVSSYEAKIRSIGAIFDTTHQLLQDFQGSFLDTKQEREKLRAELRENLAKNESLRKKDFDNMMQEILSIQERGEKEVRNLLNNYLNEQKEMAHTLRNNLAKVKDALAKGDAGMVKEIQVVIKGILANQEERKEKAIFKLKEFQKDQQQMTKRLEELLAKGKELRIKDLKLMLAEFKRQHEERISRQQQRKKAVQTMQKKMAEERAIPSAAVNVGM